MKEKTWCLDPTDTQHKATGANIEQPTGVIAGGCLGDATAFSSKGRDRRVQDASEIGPASNLGTKKAREIRLRTPTREVGLQSFSKPRSRLTDRSPDIVIALDATVEPDQMQCCLIRQVRIGDWPATCIDPWASFEIDRLHGQN